MKSIRMRKDRPQPTSKLQSGVMLLEALIGILIFSLGILALVGMQATAVRATTDARDRTEASNLASQVVGEMWLDRANLANYAYNGGGTPPAALANWVNQVENALPGAVANQPTVTIGASASLPAAVGTEVQVVVFWQNPTDPNLHQFAITAYIN
jgi:type IV pilus assembly protein PilV